MHGIAFCTWENILVLVVEIFVLVMYVYMYERSERFSESSEGVKKSQYFSYYNVNNNCFRSSLKYDFFKVLKVEMRMRYFIRSLPEVTYWV